MGFLLSILSSIGQSILKIFLGGLFNKVMTQVEDEAQHKLDAAVIVAQSQSDAAKVEVQIAQDQAAVKEKMDAQTGTVEDPFNQAEWNKP